MQKIGIIIVLLAAIIVPTMLLATQAQQGNEVRINAYKHADGRIEFALRVREGTDWSERIEPDVSILPANASSERWYTSSSILIGDASSASHMTAEDESQPDATEGHVGELYEWTYRDHDWQETTLERHRVEWSTQTSNAGKAIRVTLPYDEWSCDGHPCRYELYFWCSDDDSTLAVVLRKLWLFGDRVAEWGHQDGQRIGWQYRKHIRVGRITTSIDHSSFTQEWQVYEPSGQDDVDPSYSYGGDFFLLDGAGRAFMERAQDTDSLTINVGGKHLHDEWETFTFDLTSAFGNPATALLSQCGAQ